MYKNIFSGIINNNNNIKIMYKSYNSSFNIEFILEKAKKSDLKENYKDVFILINLNQFTIIKCIFPI